MKTLEDAPKKKTKIICTIGPASLQTKVLRKMGNAGMNGARINTAYGTRAQYTQIIDKLRAVSDIPIIVDIKGPEIRLRVPQKRIVKKGEVVQVSFGEGPIRFNHNFYDKINIGDQIYIDNGRIQTKVIEKTEDILRLAVLTGGELDDGKGVNIPNKQLSVPTLSEKDLELIDFAQESEVDFIALSFTRSVEDVKTLRARASNFKGGLIAKIENFEGLQNFEDILAAVEGVMVARGDLGVEIPPEKVPLLQKSIIRRCNQKGKTVVTATDMLESMIYQPTPTRAEVSDVANAILDGTDAMMLSGETSIGHYPTEAVAMMSRIARETESAVNSSVEGEKHVNISDTISKSIKNICQNMHVDQIVTLTRSGYTARMIARFKVAPSIIAVTPESLVKRQLELDYNVYPVHMDYRKERDRILAVAKKLYSMNLLREQDIVLFTAAFRTAMKHASNLIELHNLGELLATS